jgi:zinc protease
MIGFPALAPLPSPMSLLSSGMGAVHSGGTLLSGGARPLLGVEPVQTALLANGVTGYFLQMPGQSRSQVTVALPVGDLSPAQGGLLMDLLQDGSNATKQMLSQFRGQGISISTRARDNQLLVMADGPAGQEAALVQAVFRLLLQPIVDPTLFNGIKTRSLQSWQGELNNPDEQLTIRLRQRIYGPNHPFALSTQASLQAVAQQDLPGLTAHLQRMLQATGAAKVMMISAQPAAQQRMILDSAIQGSGWYRSAYSAATAPQAMPLPSATALRGLVLLPTQASDQALIQTLWKTPDVRDPDYVPYKLLMNFLHSENEGALYQVMRQDHGLIYSVDLDEEHRLAAGNCFHINVEVPYDKIQPALNDIRATTQAVCQAPIPAVALETLKRNFLREMRTSLQDAVRTGCLYAEWLRHEGPPPDLQRLQAAVARTTPADLQRVANRIFNAPDSLQLVGVSAPAAVLQQCFPGQPLVSPAR